MRGQGGQQRSFESLQSFHPMRQARLEFGVAIALGQIQVTGVLRVVQTPLVVEIHGRLAATSQSAEQQQQTDSNEHRYLATTLWPVCSWTWPCMSSKRTCIVLPSPSTRHCVTFTV